MRVLMKLWDKCDRGTSHTLLSVISEWVILGTFSGSMDESAAYEFAQKAVGISKSANNIRLRKSCILQGF